MVAVYEIIKTGAAYFELVKESLHLMLCLHGTYFIIFSILLEKWFQQTPPFFLFQWYGEVGESSGEASLRAGEEKGGAGKCCLVCGRDTLV